MRSASSVVLVVGVSISLYVFGACSSTETVTAPLSSDASDGTSASDCASTVEEADSGLDTSEAGPTTSCVIQITKRCPESDEGCDVFAALPSGDEFCTLSCEKATDCPRGVVCNPNVGACMPPCTEDKSCTAAGFLRCDQAGKTCTTIP